MTVTLPDVSPGSIGALIALYERAVGFYATLVNVNAYRQPGVEAGKKAAASVLELQRKVLAALREHRPEAIQNTTSNRRARQLGRVDVTVDPGSDESPRLC